MLRSFLWKMASGISFPALLTHSKSTRYKINGYIGRSYIDSHTVWSTSAKQFFFLGASSPQFQRVFCHISVTLPEVGSISYTEKSINDETDDGNVEKSLNDETDDGNLEKSQETWSEEEELMPDPDWEPLENPCLTDDPTAGKMVVLKILTKGQHPIEGKCIPQHTWTVLKALKKAGHMTYLVGGSVRDHYLKKTPKDYDLVSTADPHEVKKLFPGQAAVFGKRVPICQIRRNQNIVEVASMQSGHGMMEDSPPDSFQIISDGPHPYSWMPEDSLRLSNALKRDFTVNALLFDPYGSILYDYVGAISDLEQRKIRTITPVERSFTEDANRALRGIRLAARLNLTLDKSICDFMEISTRNVARLQKSRLSLELENHLVYGSCEPSLRLLWKYRFLDILLPLQADFLRFIGFPRHSEGHSNFLFDLIGNMDSRYSTSEPCNLSLCFALFALQLAVFRLVPDVVSTSALALAVADGDGMLAASKKARRIHLRVQEELGEASKMTVQGAGYPAEVEYSLRTEMVLPKISRQAEMLLSDARDQLVNFADSERVFAVMAEWDETYFKSNRSVFTISKTNVARSLKILQVQKAELDTAMTSRLENLQGKVKKSQQVEDSDMESSRFAFSRVVLSTLYPGVGQGNR